MFFDKNTSETMPVLLFREQHKSIKKSQSRLLSWSMQYARYIVHQIESQKSCIYICMIFQFVELMLMQKKMKATENCQLLTQYIETEIFSVIDMHLISRSY